MNNYHHTISHHNHIGQNQIAHFLFFFVCLSIYLFVWADLRNALIDFNDTFIYELSKVNLNYLLSRKSPNFLSWNRESRNDLILIWFFKQPGTQDITYTPGIIIVLEKKNRSRTKSRGPDSYLIYFRFQFLVDFRSVIYNT